MRLRGRPLLAWLCAAPLALVVVVSSHAATTPDPGQKPPRILIGSERATLLGVLGAYCWTQSDGQSFCVAGTGARSRHALPIRAGGRVSIDVRLPAREVSYSLVRGTRTLLRGKAVREGDSGTGWRFQMTRRKAAFTATELLLFVKYPQGSVSSSIRVRRDRRAIVPRIVGLSESRAECALRRRGLRWRYAGDRRVHSTPVAPCRGGTQVTPDPKVLEQKPEAGARLRRSGVVEIENECTRRRLTGEPACA